MVKAKNYTEKQGYKRDLAKPYKIATIVLAAISVGLLGGLIFAVTQTSEEKEYLGVYEHLMQRYPELKCESGSREQITAVQDDNGKYIGMLKDEKLPDTRVCMMTDYGVSKDGDPYVSYVQRTYDPETHEQKSAKNMTLYFQHYNGHYAEALGEN